MNALAAALLLLVSEPAEPTVVQSVDHATPARGFVFAWWAGPTMGISAIPSISPATAFFGARTGSPWALGYQISLSIGGAERYFGDFFIPMAHRHHVTAMRSFGRNRRGLVGTGGGVAFTGRTNPVAELEGRVAVRFGSGKWHLGALLRLGLDIGHDERAPMPQFGIFIGLTNL